MHTGMHKVLYTTSTGTNRLNYIRMYKRDWINTNGSTSFHIQKGIMSMCIALIAHPNYCYAIVFACMIDLPLNLIIVSNTESVQWENVFNTRFVHATRTH